MSEHLAQLTQQELLAAALEHSRRHDAGAALACLKAACDRGDASPQAFFMLGSEYAQLGLVAEAKAAMARAAEFGPALPLARFQLGMLHLTSGAIDEAKAAWEPLAQLAPSDPDAYLATLRSGMLHVVNDEFDAAVHALAQGVAQNHQNEPLNGDIRRVIDAIEHLPGRTRAARGAGGPAPGVAPGPVPSGDVPISLDGDAGVHPGHLFISAYTQGGKPH